VTRPKPLAILAWLVGPLAVAALAGEVGSLHAKTQRGQFFGQTASLAEAERKLLEAVPARVMDNVTWTLSGADTARKLVKFELDGLGDLDAPRRARLFIRFGLADSNFDGQAAVFALACAADASVCDTERLKEAAVEEASQRFVAPGNHLPLSMIGGHPPIGGP
jgi:hypothetical protein